MSSNQKQAPEPFADFVRRYRPVEHYTGTSDETGSLFFQTHGSDLTFVQAQDAKHVWSLLDNGRTIVPGLRPGCLSYFVCIVPYTMQAYDHAQYAIP